MGFRQLMHRLFTDEESADVRLVRMVADLGGRLSRLEEQVLSNQESFRSFRGRVYADKRWGAPTDPQESPEQLDIHDPRLTKAQVKAALAARGALKPRSDN